MEFSFVENFLFKFQNLRYLSNSQLFHNSWHIEYYYYDIKILQILKAKIYARFTLYGNTNTYCTIVFSLLMVRMLPPVDNIYIMRSIYIYEKNNFKIATFKTLVKVLK